ncbi:hypothetical protein N7G274_000609 [Stereocaulon virgatum]|uniref:Carbonic anhydrase n=1 Tax=Stereocaulon virgatum TaxID=373712 RepID=A0ABR4ASL5_9LECA
MAPDPRVANFLTRNASFTASYTPAPSMADIIKKREPFIVIVCCTDGRGDPRAFFNLQENEAVVQANCGGRVTPDVLRTLHVLDLLSNDGVGTVIVCHHTDCGMINVSDDEMIEIGKKKWGAKKGKVEGMWFGAFEKGKAVRENVKGEMEVVRRDRWLGKRVLGLEVLGFVLDVETGKAEEVKL